MGSSEVSVGGVLLLAVLSGCMGASGGSLMVVELAGEVDGDGPDQREGHGDLFPNAALSFGDEEITVEEHPYDRSPPRELMLVGDVRVDDPSEGYPTRHLPTIQPLNFSQTWNLDIPNPPPVFELEREGSTLLVNGTALDEGESMNVTVEFTRDHRGATYRYEGWINVTNHGLWSEDQINVEDDWGGEGRSAYSAE